MTCLSYALLVSGLCGPCSCTIVSVSAQDRPITTASPLQPPGEEKPKREQAAATSAPTVEPVPKDQAERREPLVALKHRDFRLLFGGNFISQLGSQMRVVAVGVQL